MTISPAETPPGESKPTPLEPPKPLLGFTPEEFQARRAALRAACPNGMVLLRGATEDEVTKPVGFHQNSSFLYLTGVETPGAFLVLLPEDIPATAGLRGTPPEVKEILFLPARNPTVETWTGPKLGPGAETEKATGIAKAADVGSLWGALMAWIHYNPVVYLPTPYGENARLTREHALMQRLQDIAPVVQFRDASLAIARLRMVKSPAEVARIAEAIAVTQEGHRIARKRIAGGEGTFEYAVEAAIFEAFRSRGAGLAFASIVGGGVNGTILHYEANSHPLKAGDLVVVDIGAKVGGYCGDLTRTYPVGGVFGAREREIYALVLDAHERTLSGYKPGDRLQDLTERCKAFLKDSPLRSKDAKGVEQTMDQFMPHGISHHLGLDVHDAGDGMIPLAPGNVITVEPGIYLPSEGIGVRIEDDYLVTETGLQRLGPSLEKGLAELEAETVRPV